MIMILHAPPAHFRPMVHDAIHHCLVLFLLLSPASMLRRRRRDGLLGLLRLGLRRLVVVIARHSDHLDELLEVHGPVAVGVDDGDHRLELLGRRRLAEAPQDLVELLGGDLAVGVAVEELEGLQQVLHEVLVEDARELLETLLVDAEVPPLALHALEVLVVPEDLGGAALRFVALGEHVAPGDEALGEHVVHLPDHQVVLVVDLLLDDLLHDVLEREDADGPRRPHERLPPEQQVPRVLRLGAHEGHVAAALLELVERLQERRVRRDAGRQDDAQRLDLARVIRVERDEPLHEQEAAHVAGVVAGGDGNAAEPRAHYLAHGLEVHDAVHAHAVDLRDGRHRLVDLLLRRLEHAGDDVHLVGRDLLFTVRVFGRTMYCHARPPRQLASAALGHT
mmetsp:Transcript_25266/g.79291  ORF Transcript_25266/g.79291 Transcript_25266/m.79291 type:complete len:393 (-) Transcript_25266:914-2092(-)